MEKFSLLVRLEAKPGKEQQVADFIKGALPLAQQEEQTIRWYALQIGPSTFGIFDTFETEEGRNAHLGGEIAKALIANARESLRLRRLVAGHFLDNPASGRVLAKLGFRPTGVTRLRWSEGRKAEAPCREFTLDLTASVDEPCPQPCPMAA